MARGVRLALEHDAARGEIFNLGEARAWSTRAWIEQVVATSGHQIEMERVPDDAVPPDLGLTTSIRQHLVCDSSKAARMLGWVHADPSETVPRSVRWHLEHPPAEPAPDFSADDTALARAVG